MTRHLIAAMLLAASAGGWAEEGATAREWLERSYQAAGGAAWDTVRTSRASFLLKLPDFDGQAVATTDVCSGRYLNEARIGPYEFANGLDGDLQWSRDPSGQIHVEDSQAEREGTVSERYRRMLAYWYPQRWPAELADLGKVGEDDRALRRIRITPRGGRAFELWIDEDTALIDRIVENDGSGDETIYLYDYDEAEGRLVPHATRFSSGEALYDQFTTLLLLEFNVALEEGMFGMPQPATEDEP